MEAKEIIERLHAQWLVAKDQRRQRCEAGGMEGMAAKLAACDMFKGTESVDELARLFTTPQGVEFCLAANFPNLATFRALKPYVKPARHNVYIDAGCITLNNPGTAVLVGKTMATVKCDTCERHTVITMHGASATVLAHGWSVVRTEAGNSTSIIRRTSENAVIL